VGLQWHYYRENGYLEYISDKFDQDYQ
jgi:hypothetical protein